MPEAKGKNTFPVFADWLCVRALLQCLARRFPILCYCSHPICIEHKCQSKMKALGLLRSFLSMCPTLGVYGLPDSLVYVRFSKRPDSPSYLLPQPLPSQGFWFVHGLHCPSCHPLPQVAVVNTFAFKPFQQTAPLQPWGSSKAGEIKVNARAGPSGIHQAGQNTNHSSLGLRFILFPFVLAAFMAASELGVGEAKQVS